MIIKGVPLGFIDKEGTGLVRDYEHIAYEKGISIAKALVYHRTGTVPPYTYC